MRKCLFIFWNFHLLFVKKTWQIISKNDWLELDSSDVASVLKSDNLRADTEEQVFEGLIKWAQKDWSQRKLQFQDLLKDIRFTQLSKQVECSCSIHVYIHMYVHIYYSKKLKWNIQNIRSLNHFSLYQLTWNQFVMMT